MTDEPIKAKLAAKRLRSDEGQRRGPGQGRPVFADQIVQTHEAIATARELLKPVSKPPRVK